ncbi:VWA domain-containing protein [Facklamia sp. DSM 111018]|uniref:VWA domain-containing protein n=1 Tax=Facklamia lactis TaxID=2749967 RepID=A0ABS0LQ63_9LACT|nr:substrate-binding and VWA domain-containing protein [Facklamia lactis]MBG9980508.1 VWA domain-containing protein [Facklamia lactis]MBG9986300.1 VWA domain-containing protein [Facklamia lactis]
MESEFSFRRFGSLCLKMILMVGIAFFALSACDREDEEKVKESDFAVTDFSGDVLRIVAGSENKELEPIIEKYAQDNKVNITIDYLGSLDIMRQLQSGEMEYDAVWPASSIWLTLGDDHRLLKHSQTTSISPVVFGIKQSLAEELGFVGEEVHTEDIIEAIKKDQLEFAMTSATQSNSGASAYLGFLTAIAGSEGGLTMEELQKPETGEQIQQLLAGVNRSSGSSNWLVDLFLTSDYDAMVNYETLIIQTNKELEAQGRETLYTVYPVDGLAISDSPLAYVDHDDQKKEETFLAFQEYLLSDAAQKEIEATGKRSRYGTVTNDNKESFKPEWGINVDQVISPIRWPSSDVIKEALGLYQTQFKKPALTVYVLDYSGSMRGEGHRQMLEALEEVLLPEKAEKNLLLGTSKDQTILIPFADEVEPSLEAKGNDQEMIELNSDVQELDVGGGTAMYEGIQAAYDLIEEEYGTELDQYTPAIVVLTDGQPNGELTFEDLDNFYQDFSHDVPVFSILFGDAREEEMEEIASLTNARVFDGRSDLVNAFRQVKGYN